MIQKSVRRAAAAVVLDTPQTVDSVGCRHLPRIMRDVGDARSMTCAFLTTTRAVALLYAALTRVFIAIHAIHAHCLLGNITADVQH